MLIAWDIIYIIYLVLSRSMIDQSAAAVRIGLLMNCMISIMLIRPPGYHTLTHTHAPPRYTYLCMMEFGKQCAISHQFPGPHPVSITYGTWLCPVLMIKQARLGESIRATINLIIN